MTGASEPADLRLLDAAALLRARKLSALELLTSCQRHIQRGNGGPPSFDGAPDAVNAWVRLYPDLAKALARKADERLRREGDRAPLMCGIPLGLKDVLAVSGLPLTASSRVLEGHVADEDCLVWQRLSEAGMVLVGHTQTHEFAAGGTTDQVGNPWALDRSAGGSSGGSAAALAAGMVPAAIGTDTQGSLRIPAALCGVSTIKPTNGRVPMNGIVPLAPTLDHVGPMAHTVADAAAILTALTRDGAQVTPLMPPPAAMPELPLAPRARDRPLAGLTVAVSDRPDAFALAPDVREALRIAQAASTALGATVIEVPAVPDMLVRESGIIKFAETWAYHERYAQRADAYRPSIREFVNRGRTVGTAADYLAAQLRRQRLTAEWEAWFRRHRVDALLEPTVVSPAPPRGEGYASYHRADDRALLIELTATWNATGFPVVALPVGLGRESGLPVGVSLVGVRGAEWPLVQLGIDLQNGPLPPIGPVPAGSRAVPERPRQQKARSR